MGQDLLFFRKRSGPALAEKGGKEKMKKRLIAILLAAVTAFSLCACGDSGSTGTDSSTSSSDSGDEETTYTIGLCNYVDDASLNQIAENIQDRLDEIETEKGVTFNVEYDNCNADENVLSQIITNFQADGADLMIGIATPVAIAMQTATEESGTPVVFAAVSDPVGSGVVESLDSPGYNLTGTSDRTDTETIFKIMFAVDPDLNKVGLLYDLGQDSSTAAIQEAKDILDAKGIEYVERTGTTDAEMVLAAQALVADGVQAVFTPADNTVMKSEQSICGIFSDAGIKHYGGADSFALWGAFLGFGVDYAQLGRETADMAADILLNGKDPKDVPVETFDDGIATVNTDVCDKLGISFDDVKAAISEYCNEVNEITTGESFE
jgi:putative ABC transport system substrate-binding protein